MGTSDSMAGRRFEHRQTLSTAESDRVVRYARILSLATKLMHGSEEHAREWLSSPAHALCGSTPLETAVTETGARRVEDIVIALECELFS